MKRVKLVERVGSTRGFSATELAVTLALAGILVALVAPSLGGWVTRQQMRGALNQVSADTYYARILAVRAAQPTSLRFTQVSSQPRCYSGRYTVVIEGAEDRSVRSTDLEIPMGMCLDVGANSSITFDPRGMLAPFNNRTVRVWRGAARDSVRISVLGRVQRMY